MVEHRSTQPSAHHHDEVEAAVETSRVWLAHLAADLNTDVAGARRILRAWLHAVRDRTRVADAVHLAAQLPELIRGMYYEGWAPSRVPVPHDSATFVADFARAAAIPESEVATVAPAVTASLSELFSPGHLQPVFATLPVHLRRLLNRDALIDAPQAVLVDFGAAAGGDRLAELEDRVRALSDAVAVMARGFEELPHGSSSNAHGGNAAQEAHRILLRDPVIIDSSHAR